MVQADNIHLLEEHSSTLPIWWANRKSAGTVVYLDAHLDLQQTEPGSLAALKACTRLDEVKRLETPNHLNPSTRYAYGIENFLYAAHQLGLVERLVWVAPTHIPRHYSSTLIDYVQQMDGITFEELTGFKETGRNIMQGRLLGLDITICDYDALDSLGIDDNYYLDIDIDYFIEVPADRLWIDPAIVIDTIRAQLGEPSLVTISRAVSSGFTPITFRYLGDYIYSQMSDSKVEFDYYHKLSTAILDQGNGHPAGARQVCEQLIEDEPELAAAYFILGVSTSDAKQKNHLLDEAGRRDAGYRFDLSREAIGLLNRKKSANPDKLRELMAAFESLEMEQPQRQLAEVALAQVLGASGNSNAARSLLGRQAGDYAEHDEVLLSIVVSQLADGARHAENKRMLRSICSSEKNATIANVYLGDLEFSEQNYQAALEHYSLAHNRAQAWMLPLERMLACYAKLGMTGKTSDINDEISARRQRLEIILGKNQ